jgi:hypothetical protein
MDKGKTYTKKIGRQTPSVKVLIKRPEHHFGGLWSGLPTSDSGLATRERQHKKNPPGNGRVYAKVIEILISCAGSDAEEPLCLVHLRLLQHRACRLYRHHHLPDHS